MSLPNIDVLTSNKRKALIDFLSDLEYSLSECIKPDMAKMKFSRSFNQARATVEKINLRLKSKYYGEEEEKYNPKNGLLENIEELAKFLRVLSDNINEEEDVKEKLRCAARQIEYGYKCFLKTLMHCLIYLQLEDMK